MPAIAGILQAVDMIVSLTERVNSVTTLIKTAQAENRDVTPAELDAAAQGTTDALKALAEAIAAARAKP